MTTASNDNSQHFANQKGLAKQSALNRKGFDHSAKK